MRNYCSECVKYTKLRPKTFKIWRKVFVISSFCAKCDSNNDNISKGSSIEIFKTLG